jgi:hypothetical protein
MPVGSVQGTQAYQLAAAQAQQLREQLQRRADASAEERQNRSLAVGGDGGGKRSAGPRISDSTLAAALRQGSGNADEAAANADGTRQAALAATRQAQPASVASQRLADAQALARSPDVDGEKRAALGAVIDSQRQNRPDETRRRDEDRREASVERRRNDRDELQNRIDFFESATARRRAEAYQNSQRRGDRDAVGGSVSVSA